MSAFVCTADDRQRWRRLVDEARACAMNPRRNGEELRRAADKAARAIFPDQAPDLREPFRKLVGFGQSWSALDGRGRAGNAAAVLALVDACAAQLGDPAPASALPAGDRSLPFRADVDG